MGALLAPGYWDDVGPNTGFAGGVPVIRERDLQCRGDLGFLRGQTTKAAWTCLRSRVTFLWGRKQSDTFGSHHTRPHPPDLLPALLLPGARALLPAVNLRLLVDRQPDVGQRNLQTCPGPSLRTACDGFPESFREMAPRNSVTFVMHVRSQCKPHISAKHAHWKTKRKRNRDRTRA